LQPYVEEWRERGLDIVLVTTDPAESIKTLFRTNGLSYPVLLDTEYEGGRAYNVGGIPHTAFIDAGGALRQTHIGWGAGALEKFNAEAEKLLAAAPASRP